MESGAGFQDEKGKEPDGDGSCSFIGRNGKQTRKILSVEESRG